MDRAFRQGHLDIDFPTTPFRSVLPLLADAVRVFVATSPFLASATLIVYLPGKLVTQLLCHVFDVPFEGVLSYLLLVASDMLLGALVVPAIVFGLVAWLRKGRMATLGESFRWGRRQFGRTLTNQIAVEVTVALWGALLIVPGIVAMVRLIFTDIVVAVEGDQESQPLARSRKLTQGGRWRIFGVMLPVMLLGLGATFLVLDRIQAATHSRLAFAIADSVLAIAAQFGTVATFLMYLGTVQPRVTKLKP